MQMIKQCFLLLVLGTAALFMPHAKATCTTPDLPKMINVASISVPTTLTVGETIPGTEQVTHVAGSCDQSIDSGLEIVSCYYGTGAEISGLKGVYASGVPGIGVALMNDRGQRISGGGGVNCISTGTPVGYVSSDGKRTFDFDVTLELVKTSTAVASGTLDQNQTRFGIGLYHHEGIGDPNSISYAGNIILQEVTCSVSPKSLTVVLGDFPVSQFFTTGLLTDEKDFNISITCNTTVQPELKISSTNGYVPGFGGVIKLTPESGVATGVGVFMVTDGKVPAFDEYFTTSSPANANETLNIPFKVRYEQINDIVTPGPANTVATITVAYK
ncbi:fimbrial protein [Enterobacter hormaechei]|uniref:fimbrial protein n=1 Tax=Enterobacter hormaechei TaxID=158836 RepID=UPI003B8850B4